MRIGSVRYGQRWAAAMASVAVVLLPMACSGDDAGRDVPAADPTSASTDLAEPSSTAPPTYPDAANGVWLNLGQAGPQPVFARHRVTAAGIELLLEALEWEGSPEVLPEGTPADWAPAPWCEQRGTIEAYVVDEPMVESLSFRWAKGAIDGATVELRRVGSDREHVVDVVLVQVDPGVAAVAARFPNGAVDEAAPEGGLVLLAARGPTGTDAPEVVLTTEDGRTEEIDVLEHQADGQSPRWVEECTPPPPGLPAAGEQPADPEAAVAEIEGAVSVVFAQVEGVTDADVLARLDDPTGVQPGLDSMRSGPYADRAAAAVYTVDEVVFTSPTTAWLRYTLAVPNVLPATMVRFGQAVLVDGVWKLTRATLCQDLDLAGDGCIPPVATIQPPT